MPYISCEDAQCDYPEGCTHDHWVHPRMIWRIAKNPDGSCRAPERGMRVQKDVGGVIYAVAGDIEVHFGIPCVPLLTPGGERVLINMDVWRDLMIEAPEEET